MPTGCDLESALHHASHPEFRRHGWSGKRHVTASAGTPVTPQQLRLKASVLDAANEESGPGDVRVVLDLSLAG